MAQLVAELLGEALLKTIRSHKSRISERSRQMIDWLREVAEPPDGVELKSKDGSSYTGFVVVERNELVMMLAVRHPPGHTPPAPPRPPSVTPPQRERPLYQGMLDPDDPQWDRDGDPYRR